jgi:hypothetical protein
MEVHPFEGVIFRNGRSRLFQVRNDATTETGEGTGGGSGTSHDPVTLGAGSDAALSLSGQELTLADVATQAELDTHEGDVDAHHDPVTLGVGSDAALSLSGQELTLANVATQAELNAHGSDVDAHHDPVTLGAGSDSILALSGQELTLGNVATQAELNAHAADDDVHHPLVSLGADVAPLMSIGAGQVLNFDNQSPNTFLAGPVSGSDADPTVRAMVQADIPADSIDDTKAGDRVPQFYRRQGGSATDWSSPGTTTRTPGAVRMQAGVIEWTGSAATGDITVTFPQAYSNVPIVLSVCVDTAEGGEEAQAINTSAFNTSANAVELGWLDLDATTRSSVTIAWLAIGPE